MKLNVLVLLVLVVAPVLHSQEWSLDDVRKVVENHTQTLSQVMRYLRKFDTAFRKMRNAVENKHNSRLSQVETKISGLEATVKKNSLSEKKLSDLEYISTLKNNISNLQNEMQKMGADNLETLKQLEERISKKSEVKDIGDRLFSSRKGEVGEKGEKGDSGFLDFENYLEKCNFQCTPEFP